MSTRVLPSTRFRSKTVAAALAFFTGSLGAHRFYLYGPRDPFGWLHLCVTMLAGIPGVLLLIASDRASLLGWALAIPGAISLFAAFIAAIAYGLRPDARWDAQFNPHLSRRSRSGWAVIFVVIFSLFIGAMLLMGGLAVTVMTYFEAQQPAATAAR